MAAIVHGREILRSHPMSTLCLARELAIIEMYTNVRVRVRSCRAELPATKPPKHDPLAVVRGTNGPPGIRG